ncbi:MAG: hypothetical protein J6Q53_04205 [Oscillospiraceae bacterium]|nr:hypothetical protein [Oscillospiraceae bacterium]
MRKYFDHAFEGLCNTLQPFAELVGCMGECAKITLVYITIPLWIVPYMVYLKIKERKENHA